MTKQEIERRLLHPGIDKKIRRIINASDPLPLHEMILLAEYLDREYGKGYVVYWCTHGYERFEVCNYERYDDTKLGYGPTHWHTGSCPL